MAHLRERLGARYDDFDWRGRLAAIALVPRPGAAPVAAASVEASPLLLGAAGALFGMKKILAAAAIVAALALVWTVVPPPLDVPVEGGTAQAEADGGGALDPVDDHRLAPVSGDEDGSRTVSAADATTPRAVDAPTAFGRKNGPAFFENLARAYAGVARGLHRSQCSEQQLRQLVHGDSIRTAGKNGLALQSTSRCLINVGETATNFKVESGQVVGSTGSSTRFGRS